MYYHTPIKTFIVKECYGYCRLHDFLSYTMREKKELENEFYEKLNLCWSEYCNTISYTICNNMFEIRSEIRDLIDEHCDLLNKHMYFRRNIKKNQKKIKIFSKHHNICKDIQCLILDFIVEKPKYII